MKRRDSRIIPQFVVSTATDVIDLGFTEGFKTPQRRWVPSLRTISVRLTSAHEGTMPAPTGVLSVPRKTLLPPLHGPLKRLGEPLTIHATTCQRLYALSRL
jgi:hypothetical protein